MAIRNACKAWVVRDGQVLLNRNARNNSSSYYDMPGGGQNPYETLEEAVVRECLEETGYTVRVGKLLCVHESVCMLEDLREKLPDYTHIVFFVFECELTDAQKIEPTEPDMNQSGTVWVPLEDLRGTDFRPPRVLDYLLNGYDPQTITHIPVDKWPTE